MKEGMWPLTGANKIPPQPVPGEFQEFQETVYLDGKAPPHYEYIESPTTGSESSQCLDPDSSDDDSHGECGRGDY